MSTSQTGLLFPEHRVRGQVSSSSVLLLLSYAVQTCLVQYTSHVYASCKHLLLHMRASFHRSIEALALEPTGLQPRSGSYSAVIFACAKSTPRCRTE